MHTVKRPPYYIDRTKDVIPTPEEEGQLKARISEINPTMASCALYGPHLKPKQPLHSLLTETERHPLIVTSYNQEVSLSDTTDPLTDSEADSEDHPQSLDT